MAVKVTNPPSFLSFVLSFAYSLVPRRLRQCWWWWWCSASLGSLITSFTCGRCSGPSRWTRAPLCYGWPPTAWRTATHLSTRSSTPSCRRTSGRRTSRCSNARSEPVTPRSTTLRRSAAKRRRRPRLTAPTFDWQGVEGDVKTNLRQWSHWESAKSKSDTRLYGCFFNVGRCSCLDSGTPVLYCS